MLSVCHGAWDQLLELGTRDNARGERPGKELRPFLRWFFLALMGRNSPIGFSIIQQLHPCCSSARRGLNPELCAPIPALEQGRRSLPPHRSLCLLLSKPSPCTTSLPSRDTPAENGVNETGFEP